MPVLQEQKPACPLVNGRHCVTAYAGLRPCAPMQGDIPLRTPWPAFQLTLIYKIQSRIRARRGIHAPGRSFGIHQTMLLDFINIGLERMGRENTSRLKSEYGLRPEIIFWVLREAHQKTLPA